MANRKDIELVLQTKFEAVDSDAGAMQFAQKFSETLMREFASLGDKIGQQLLEGIQKKLGNFQAGSNVQQGLLDQFGKPMGGAPSNAPAVFTPQPAPGAPAANVVDGTPAGQAPSFNQSNPETDAMNQAARQFRIRPAAGSRVTGFASLITNTFNRIPGMSADEADRFNQPAMDMARQADGVYSKFKAYETAKKFDPGARLEDFNLSKDALSNAGQIMTRTAQGAGPELAKLIDSITKLTMVTDKNRQELEELRRKKPEELADRDKARLQYLDKQEALLVEKQTARADMENVTNAAFKQGAELSAAGKAGDPKWYQNQSLMRGIGTAAGIGSVAFDFMSGLDSSLLRGQAGTAAVQGFGTRDIMSKNYVGTLATASLGGEENLRGRAGMSQTLSTVGDGLGAVASGVGAYFTGGPTNPVGALLTANSARMAANFGTSIIERDAAINQRMKGLQGDQIMKDQERLEMYVAGRGNATGAYRNSLAMGSDSFADFMTGTRSYKNPISFADRDRGVQPGTSSSMMAYAAQGLDAGVMGADLATYQAEGGAYRGRNIMGGEYMQKLINSGAELRGQGFSTVAATSAAFARGMNTYRDTGNFDEDFSRRQGEMAGGMQTAQRLFRDIRGAGFEESSANALIGQISSVAGSGIGASEFAENTGRMALAQAQAIGASGPGQSMQILQANQRIQQDGMTGAGLNGIAKLQAVDKLEQELAKQGITLTQEQRFKAQLTKFGAKELSDLGVKDADKLAAKFQNDYLGGRNNLLDLQGAGMVDAIQRSDGSWGSADNIFDATRSGATALKTDVAAETLGQKPKDAPVGKREAVQEATDDAVKVTNGMTTLSTAIGILEEASRKAAEKLEALARNTDFAKEQQQEKQKADEQAQRDIEMYETMQYAGMPGGTGALGMKTFMQSQGWFNNEANKRAKAPGNKPGDK